MTGAVPPPAVSPALAAVQRCRERFDRDPNDERARAALADALFAYAHELRQGGRLAAAVAAFAQAAKFAPGNAAAWVAFGNACMELELASERAAQPPLPGEDLLAHALDAFSRASTLRPDDSLIAAHCAMAARYACAWTRAERAEGELDRLARERPADFACEPGAAVAMLADARVQRLGIGGWCRKLLPTPAAPPVVRRRGTRLRLGYLSSDLHDHATAHLAAGLFEQHDRARFEVFAYASDADDGSAMRARLRRAFDHWRDVAGAGDAEAARTIADDGVDVLIDLKGHTNGARAGILARRPAPLQLHYLGFPGTLAWGAIDGTIVDDVVAPPGSDAACRPATGRPERRGAALLVRAPDPARPRHGAEGLRAEAAGPSRAGAAELRPAPADPLPA